MPLSINDYQEQAVQTAAYPSIGHNLIYPALGLAGEAGEAVDKIKKYWRNWGAVAGYELAQVHKTELIKELGDVAWYIAALASELGVSLEHVLQVNLDKLADRHQRGVIKSEGDNR